MHSSCFGRPCIVESSRQLQLQLQAAPPSKAVANAAAAAVVEGYLLSSSSSRASNAAVLLAKAAADAAKDAATFSSRADQLHDLLCYYSFQEEISRLERTITEHEQPAQAETSGRVAPEELVLVKSRRRLDRLQRRRDSTEKADAYRSSKRSHESSSSSDEDLDRLVREIGKKRLTVAEEGKLARGVQELLHIEKAKSAFVERMKREPSLQEWASASGIEERAFQRRLWRGRMCKNKMIACNIGLVTTIAKTYLDYGLPLDDLVQEGCMGLIRGIEKFDPSRGFKLSTYAYWWIKQAVGRAVTLKAHSVRLPMHSNEIISKIKRTRRALFEKNGKSPEDKEVAEAVGISVPKMYALMNSRRAVKSFDKPVGRNGDTVLQEVIPDDGVDCSENVDNRILLREDVDITLKCLKPQEREVMRLRYGLHGGRAKTLEEIGYMFNVTRERIRQIEVRAMHKLKTSEATKLLRLHLQSSF